MVNVTVAGDRADPASAIIVSLDHERYKKLILEVTDPPEVVARLRQSLPT